MHELGIAEGIVHVVCNLAGERWVRRVTVRVGVLQAASVEGLELGFEMLAQGTAAEGARLVVRHAGGDEVLVDEIELDGERREVLRRPGLQVEEAHELEGQRVPRQSRSHAQGR